MVEESKPEGAAERYDGYIADLREFFASRSVRFGQPEDVVPFAMLVSQPGPFQDEMGSMLRSILYSEDERFSREDLLLLVTLAVGESPLQAGMPGLDEALRELFRFVNQAMHQRGSSIPSEVEEEPAGSDAGSDGAGAFETAGVEDVAQPPVWNAARPSPGAPAREGVLFRAVTMAAQAADASLEPGPEPAGVPVSSEAPLIAAGDPAPQVAESVVAPAPVVPPAAGRKRRARGRFWLVPAGAFAGAAGVVLYLLWPALAHLAAAHRTAGGVGLGAAMPSRADGAVRACVSPISAGVSRVALEERSFVAHNLMDQQLYGAALQQLEAVAQADPGFPGVRLDESDALLHMKEPDRAREAIDAQIRISECLAGLPTASLNAYCATQFSPSTTAACRPQLAHIRQAAELQAALVHLELGHRINPDDGAEAAMKELQRSEANDGAQGKAARLSPAAAAAGAPGLMARRGTGRCVSVIAHGRGRLPCSAARWSAPMTEMRRLIAILLLAVFVLPTVAASLASGQDPEAGVPACCRRAGQHHCAMPMAERLQVAGPVQAAAWKVPAERCPYGPAAPASRVHADAMGTGAGPAAIGGLWAAAAPVGQAECAHRLAPERARRKRGPPFLLVF